MCWVCESRDISNVFVLYIKYEWKTWHFRHGSANVLSSPRGKRIECKWLSEILKGCGGGGLAWFHSPLARRKMASWYCGCPYTYHEACKLKEQWLKRHGLVCEELNVNEKQKQYFKEEGLNVAWYEWKVLLVLYVKLVLEYIRHEKYYMLN